MLLIHILWVLLNLDVINILMKAKYTYMAIQHTGSTCTVAARGIFKWEKWEKNIHVLT